MRVFFTPRALKNYDTIKTHIADKWGESVAKSFEKKI